jgi:hypothetical protein
VAQIGFAEWTAQGRLRQRFLGLRDDKPRPRSPGKAGRAADSLADGSVACERQIHHDGIAGAAPMVASST